MNHSVRIAKELIKIAKVLVGTQARGGGGVYGEEDENWAVRYGVAMNPSTPAESFRKLAEDEDARVREKANRHLNQ